MTVYARRRCPFAAVALVSLSLACSSPSEPSLTSVVGPGAVQSVAAAVGPPLLPEWIANPAEVPAGLQGQNNCTIPFGPGATE